MNKQQQQLLDLREQAAETDRELQRRALVASRLSSRLYHTQQQHKQQLEDLEAKMHQLEPGSCDLGQLNKQTSHAVRSSAVA